MNKEEFLQLISKVNNGTATDEEIARCSAWYNSFDAAPDWNEEELGARDLKKKYLLGQIQSGIAAKERRGIKLLYYRIAAAAAVLLILGAGLYLYQAHPFDTRQQITVYKNDVQAGSNKAYLTLSDGKRISLTDASSGEIINQAGVRVTKSAGGQLIYTIAPISGTVKHRIGSNTIETPRGGQYQIALPDGTKVWLNSASKLTYPVCFSAQAERKVELSGEAYFEVAKDKAHPFKVKSAGQEIEVLGTHFNVNSYTDEPAVKTTLVEGSVKVHSGTEVQDGIVLKPGQQSVLKDRHFRIKEVDPDDVIDWKNGEFVFTNEPLPGILRKVARWYDVEIVYVNKQSSPPTFTGSVSRLDKVSSILNMLEKASKVRFAIEGRIIKVREGA